MLDVTAPRPALWRMQVLEGFDNRRWRVMGEDSHLPEPAARKESIEVEVRRLQQHPRRLPRGSRQVSAGGVKVASLGDGRLLAEKPSEGETYTGRSRHRPRPGRPAGVDPDPDRQEVPA